MKISDVANTEDALEKLKAEASEAQAKLKDTVDFYESLTGNKLPESLHDAAEGRWIDALNDAGREMVELYPEHQRKEDAKRVIRFEVAMKILEDYETAIVKSAVSDPRAIFISGRKTSVKIGAFLAEHAGEFVITFVNVVQDFGVAVSKSIKFQLWDLLNPWKLAKTTFSVLKAVLALLPEILALVGLAAAAILSGTAIKAMMKAFNKASYKANVKALLQQRRLAESVARSKALRQGKGRVRRRKASRR